MKHQLYINRVRNIVLLGILMWFVHGCEEFYGNLDRAAYYVIDVYFTWLRESLEIDPFQAIVVCAGMLLLPPFVCMYLLLGNERVAPYGGLMTGILMTIEIHHVIESLIDGTLNSGALSAFILTCVGGYLLVISVLQIKYTHNNIKLSSNEQT